MIGHLLVFSSDLWCNYDRNIVVRKKVTQVGKGGSNMVQKSDQEKEKLIVGFLSKKHE